MGTILQGKCERCGYQDRIFAGGGLRDCDPETALSVAPEDAGLAAALKAHGGFRILRAPALCPHCRKLVALAQVTYWLPGGEEQVARAVCPVCGGPVAQGGDDLPCPVCGGPLELRPVGHWD